MKIFKAGEPLDGSHLGTHRVVTVDDVLNDTMPPIEGVEETWGGSVNHPSHYNSGGMEVIDICDALIEASGATEKEAARVFNIGKYVGRYRRKGNPVEDLEKARWYLDNLIKEVRNE